MEKLLEISSLRGEPIILQVWNSKDKYIPNLLLKERAPELLCTLRFFTLRNSDEVEKYLQRYSWSSSSVYDTLGLWPAMMLSRLLLHIYIMMTLSIISSKACTWSGVSIEPNSDFSDLQWSYDEEYEYLIVCAVMLLISLPMLLIALLGILIIFYNDFYTQMVIAPSLGMLLNAPQWPESSLPVR